MMLQRGVSCSIMVAEASGDSDVSTVPSPREGADIAALRAEVERLRAENERLRAGQLVRHVSWQDEVAQDCTELAVEVSPRPQGDMEAGWPRAPRHDADDAAETSSNAVDESANEAAESEAEEAAEKETETAPPDARVCWADLASSCEKSPVEESPAKEARVCWADLASSGEESPSEEAAAVFFGKPSERGGRGSVDLTWADVPESGEEGPAFPALLSAQEESWKVVTRKRGKDPAKMRPELTVQRARLAGPRPERTQRPAKPERKIRARTIPVDMEDGAFKVIRLLLGPKGENIQFIERETGARIQVRGRGTQHRPSEQLHFRVVGAPAEVVAAATYCEDLLHDVRKAYLAFLDR